MREEPYWWGLARELYGRGVSVRRIEAHLGRSHSAVECVLYPGMREKKNAHHKEYRADRKRYEELEGRYVEKWADRKKRREKCLNEMSRSL